MAKTQQKILGDWAENCAIFHAQQQHFECIQRNYHCRGGELDLILKRDNLLIFMEVKARSNEYYGSANEMLTPNKQRKIMLATAHFLEHFPEYTHYDYRFDLFAIQFPNSTVWNIQQLKQNQGLPYQYQWIEHAFLWQDFEI